MPGDCLSHREELARLQESPILRMGPKLETTGTEHHCTALPRGRNPVSSAHAFPKSLIYNISLMVGQTCGYEFERQEIEAAPANFAVAICSCY